MPMAGNLPLLCALLSPAAFGAVEIPNPKDTLDLAVSGPQLLTGVPDDSFKIYLTDAEQFDSNVYRLETGVDIAAIVGPGAAKSDRVNSPGGGLEGTWSFGRQSIVLELAAADNRYSNNSDLDNISSTDKVAWNWALGDILAGQLGINYLRGLAGFANSQGYTRNVYEQANYFASLRYQVGPRWALYGGIEDTLLGFGQSASQGNNSGSKAFDLGFDFVTNVDDTIGLDYRYTDTHYSNEIALGGALIEPQFRDDRARVTLRRAFSEKTSVDLSAGYTKRDYNNDLIGSFRGPIWSGALGWQPTGKTQVLFSTWRSLRAYLTNQTDYYRSTGASITPTWTATEKISFSLLVSREAQSYIGSSPSGLSLPGRKDTVNAESLSMNYAPTSALSFDLTYRHEQRDSTQPLKNYTDELATAGVRFQF